MTLGRLLLGSWLAVSWSVVWVLILGGTSAFWTAPEYWDADDIALEMSDAPNRWKQGRLRKQGRHLVDWWV